MPTIKMHECFRCKESFVKSILLKVKADMLFCGPCHDATYFKCSHPGCCDGTAEKPARFKLRDGDLALTPDGQPVIPGRDLCEWCFYTLYRQCKSCNVTHPITDGIVTASQNFFCRACSVDRFFDCHICNSHHEVDRLWRRTTHGPVCTGCRVNYEQEHNPPAIANHSFKPKAKFRGVTGKSKLYYGFELEVECKASRDLNADALDLREKVKDDIGNLLYCKHDGSIQNGFEIVSHPFSWNYLLRNREALFEPIFALVKKKYHSHDSGRCGMHVHMSRAAFGPLHLYRFIQFFQSNQDFILTVSQRGTSAADLDTYTRIPYNGDKAVNKKTVARLARNHGYLLGAKRGQRDDGERSWAQAGRYQAVNLQNEKTVEIRLFRGTLKRERFFKNLEFCHALYEFTLISSNSQCDLPRFLGFVTRYRSEYPYLYAFLQEKYKWDVLKRPAKKGDVKEAVRYGGPRAISPILDCQDEEWLQRQEERRKQREERIRKNIEAAKARKLATTNNR